MLPVYKTLDLQDVIIDGNQSGARTQYADIWLDGAGSFVAENCSFSNPQFACILSDQGFGSIKIDRCKFKDGLPTLALSSESETFHINSKADRIEVTNCEFSSDIVYSHSPFNKAPLGIVASYSSYAKIHGNRGSQYHIDLYTENNKCIVTNNILINGHHGGIKIEESNDIIISSNQVIDCLATQYPTILVAPYARANTYGSLRKEKNGILINGNIIDGSLDGGISVEGKLLSTAITDRDPLITQDNLIVKGVVISNNIVRNCKGLRRAGISTLFCEAPKIISNEVFDYEWTESGFVYGCIDVSNPSGTTEIKNNTVDNSGVTPSNEIGIFCNYVWGSHLYTANAIIAGNTVKNIATSGIRCNGYDYVKIKDNNFEGTTIYYIRLDTISEAEVFGNSGFNMYRGSTSWLFSSVAILRTDIGRRTKSIEQEFGAPSTGTYVKGDMRINPEPISGRPIGWICTTAGTPGTWEAFGIIGYATSVASTPISIGQIAISGGAIYMAVGISSNADWKQISN